VERIYRYKNCARVVVTRVVIYHTARKEECKIPLLHFPLYSVKHRWELLVYGNIVKRMDCNLIFLIRPSRSTKVKDNVFICQIMFTAAVTRKGEGSMYRQNDEPWPLMPVKFMYLAKTLKVRWSELTAFGCLFLKSNVP